MRLLELLSPAKNLECGISAIDHGADAVYIGARKYGARAAAGNSVEDIAKLCRYAHRYDAKVYATVNTIIYDEEMDDTLTLCRELSDAGVDALLVQDMGLLTLLRKEQSDFRPTLHASTQTDNRSTEKVRWLAEQGFKRVVLARELSIGEIRDIHQAVPDVELEAFVHGALCVSYSGQCYASHYCFGRSANRGECSQVCRMPMTLRDADGNVIEQDKHLLSLRDMAQLENLGRLADAGVTSFKIEGRLKEADYVKNVTAAYSERLNALCKQHPDKYRRTSMGRCTYTFTPDIRKSFNRGFTTYFADVNALPDDRSPMSSPLSPKSIGEYVGTVKDIRGRSLIVSSVEAFSNGDGLCFFADDCLIGFRVNKAEGNRLLPLSMPTELRRGMRLYRNHNQAFVTLLGKPSAQRKIDVTMELRPCGSDAEQETDKMAVCLTVTDEHGHCGTASTTVEMQQPRSPQEDNIRKQLQKLGDTPYICTDIKIAEGLPFMPSSILSNLRREATSLIMEQAETVKQEEKPRAHQGEATDLHQQPLYNSPELYNAANQEAREFYSQQGQDSDAFELHGGKTLMRCRYCLRHELGHCLKSKRTDDWREPLTLSINNKQTFMLHFDCKRCEMTVRLTEE
ncbi:MAG: U32 family peptidase [Prevotella sp.]|nr:U32 family peptidase [Prevotella sp.]